MKDNNSIIEKATILAVDDTPDNLLLISGLLKDDYHVRGASLLLRLHALTILLT